MMKENAKAAADEGWTLWRRHNATSRNVCLKSFQLSAGSYNAPPKRRNAIARSFVPYRELDYRYGERLRAHPFQPLRKFAASPIRNG
jgi:hypothetical protein